MFRPRTEKILWTAGIAALALFAACSGGDNPEGGQGGRRPGGGNWQGTMGQFAGAQQAVPVEVTEPFRSDLASYVFSNANIEALREVEVVARVNGQLERMAVEEGNRVRSGQVLAELDKREFTIALAEAQARLDNAKSVYERSTKMLEQELTSQEEVDRAAYDFESAKAQTDRARLNLEYATITAPFAGVITQRLVERGDLIRTNTVLFHIADTDILRIRLYVPEKEMGRVNVGDPARIETAIFPGANFAGEVEMISPVVDPATGTAKVTVRVTKGVESLKPGMFCSVYTLVETTHDALVISRRSLIPETETPEVFVVDDSSHAHRRRLTLGISQGDTVQVVNGLAGDERIVIVGQEGLNENVTVAVVGAEADSTNRSAAEPQQGEGRPRGRRTSRPVQD